ncbi:peptide synthase [Ahniella affigens]|uniref:Peptide synthase n=1 Tax=Ahniella affigens TaxID=2021234 RepID=A0A2P1PWU1_9GAMM|nr:fatty acid CoA ligase family protein [Ahniella affigens]AVP99307.1 peptide synthase [Ahniella affigens]
MTELCNIAAVLKRRAKESPERIAIRCPKAFGGRGVIEYQNLTYAELEAETNRIAAGLKASGLKRGMRTALMVRPSIELYILMFALFKLGAVPVLIDPGIDKKALKACLAEAAPEAFIGIPLAHAARIVLGWGKETIRIHITVGRRWFWGGKTYDHVRQLGFDQVDFPIAETEQNELAAILFTSGATGIPKGVEYLHRHFLAQVVMIRATFGISPGEISLPTFPPFALFDPALGMTSVIPDMDPTKPGSVNAERLVEAINQFGVTSLFGSPALVDRLARYGEQHGTKLRTLKRVISAGAPVSPDVVARLYRMLPDDAKIYTPYGATECLPVCAIEGREILDVAERTREGAGICVGKPLAANRVRILRASDATVSTISTQNEVQPGQIGEIVVLGPTTTQSYFRRPEATRKAKIVEADKLWHRMGDLGYFDNQGRLWYVGRSVHRIETGNGVFYPEQVEGVFNQHPKVKRTALVGVQINGFRTPAICVELIPHVPKQQWARIKDELRAIGARFAVTSPIRHFYPHPGFPVDIRHNAKIDRVKLGEWVAKRV